MKNQILFCIIFIIFKHVAQVPLAALATDHMLISIKKSELETLIYLDLISPTDADMLRTFFDRGGQIQHVYQLQGLLSQDHTNLSQLLPYITIEEPRAAIFQHSSKLHVQFDFLFQSPKFMVQQNQIDIFHDTNHLGPSFSFQKRIKLEWHSLDFGLQFAKDAGEPIWHQTSSKGVDFQTAFLTWSAPNANQRLQKIILGAFQMQWGQGLQLWSSRGMGKSIDLLQLARNPMGLKPFQGRDEQRFLNGLAVQFKRGMHELSLFGSFKYIDTQRPEDTLQQEFNLNYTNGLHRTPTEIAKRKQAFEQLFGIGYAHRSALWQYGVLMLYQEAQFRPFSIDTIIHSKTFQPLAMWSGGFYCQGTWRQFYFYAEFVLAAHLKSPHHLSSALNLAFIYYLDSKLEMGMHFRNYSPNYSAFYANPIGDATKGSNERGLIFQLKWQVQKKVLFKLSNESSSKPKLILPSAYPHVTNETRLLLQFQLSKHQFYEQQITYHTALNSIQQIRLRSIAHLQINANELLVLSAQLGLRQQIGLSSKQIEIDWTHAPLSSKLHFEFIFGMHQIPMGTSPIYANVHLIGVGAQTMQLNGIGAYTMTALKYAFENNWKILLGFNLNNLYSIDYHRKFYFIAAFHKKV